MTNWSLVRRPSLNIVSYARASDIWGLLESSRDMLWIWWQLKLKFSNLIFWGLIYMLYVICCCRLVILIWCTLCRYLLMINLVEPRVIVYCGIWWHHNSHSPDILCWSNELFVYLALGTVPFNRIRSFPQSVPTRAEDLRPSWAQETRPLSTNVLGLCFRCVACSLDWRWGYYYGWTMFITKEGRNCSYLRPCLHLMSDDR